MAKIHCITLSILMMVVLDSTAYSAELGAGKSLNASKGPTLEQTTDFIKSKYDEFHIDNYVYNGGTYKSNEYIYHRDIKIEGCNVVIRKKIKNNLSDNWVKYIANFNLANISNVKSSIYVADEVYNTNEQYTTTDGQPIYMVMLQSTGPDITEPISTKQAKIMVKNQEYAKRLANAFERAVQLCGGGKDIGKEELF